jgi:hypothetical protein
MLAARGLPAPQSGHSNRNFVVVTDVKLFRVTEFAESVFQSPLAHRTAVHPMWVMLLLAVWMTVLGHVPLWRALLANVAQGQTSATWLAGVAVQMFLLALALVAVVHWPGVFKWGAAALLLWACRHPCWRNGCSTPFTCEAC